jgi:hypothetical protein
MTLICNVLSLAIVEQAANVSLNVVQQATQQCVRHVSHQPRSIQALRIAGYTSRGFL